MDLKITGAKLSGDAEKDVKILANHVFQLEEQLRYQLRNLDVTNFNDLGLARYENGRLQVYAKQVEIQTEKLRLELGKETDEIRAQFEATVDGFKATVEGYGNDVKEYGSQVGGYARQVSSFNQTVDGFNTTVTNYENAVNGYLQQVSSFEQTASNISAKVSGVANDSGNVTAASIVAAINKAGSAVKISADHVDISGDLVTISDLAGTGKVEINAGNIAANGTISGCRLETATGGKTNIVIDEDYIRFTNYASIQISSDGRMGIFSERSQLDIVGYGGIRLFDADRFPSGYWELYAWGMAFIDDRTGEPVRHITAVNYT